VVAPRCAKRWPLQEGWSRSWLRGVVVAASGGGCHARGSEVCHRARRERGFELCHRGSEVCHRGCGPEVCQVVAASGRGAGARGSVACHRGPEVCHRPRCAQWWPLQKLCLRDSEVCHPRRPSRRAAVGALPGPACPLGRPAKWRPAAGSSSCCSGHAPRTRLPPGTSAPARLRPPAATSSSCNGRAPRARQPPGPSSRWPRTDTTWICCTGRAPKAREAGLSGCSGGASDSSAFLRRTGLPPKVGARAQCGATLALGLVNRGGGTRASRGTRPPPHVKGGGSVVPRLPRVYCVAPLWRWAWSTEELARVRRLAPDPPPVKGGGSVVTRLPRVYGVAPLWLWATLALGLVNRGVGAQVCRGCTTWRHSGAGPGQPRSWRACVAWHPTPPHVKGGGL